MKRLNNPQRLVDRKWSGKLDRNFPWLYHLIRRWEFPQSYTPDVVASDQVKKLQANYCRTYLEKICEVKQFSNAAPLQVPLSYVPITKNVRQLATALHHATSLGRPLEIARENPREERLFALQQKGDWHPWLWSRGKKAKDLIKANGGPDANPLPEESWNAYFKDSPPTNLGEPKWMTTSGEKLPAWHRTLLEMAMCTAQIFDLSDSVQRRIDEWGAMIDWPKDEPVLGIHIRRGDAADEDLKQTTRSSAVLNDYLAAADRIVATNNIRTIYMSTESTSEIEQARKACSEYRILSLPHDRSVFPVIANDSRFIEDVAWEQPEIIDQIVMSSLADLYFLSQCNAFIGTLNSEFSMLGWLLCIGHHQHLIPYVDMIPRSQYRNYQGNLRFWMDAPLS